MNPLVSIIIPCYNAEPWLKETLESAFLQTWKNNEIIFVNDGSTDNSLKIANSFKNAGLIIIDQENKGASAARNIGLNNSNGEFIQYLDADDLLDPYKIEKQLKILSINNNKDCVTTGSWGRFINNKAETRFDNNKLNKDLDPVEWLRIAWREFYMMHPASWLVPRHISEQSGPWNEKLSLNDDGEYFCRVVLQSKKVIYCEEAKSYYRSGISNSLSGYTNEEGLNSYYNSIVLNVENLQKYDKSSEFNSTCATYLQRFIYQVFPDVPELRKKAEQKVKQFGGTDLEPEGGPYFKILSSIIGWRNASRIRKFAYKYNYKQLRKLKFYIL